MPRATASAAWDVRRETRPRVLERCACAPGQRPRSRHRVGRRLVVPRPRRDAADSSSRRGNFAPVVRGCLVIFNGEVSRSVVGRAQAGVGSRPAGPSTHALPAPTTPEWWEREQKRWHGNRGRTRSPARNDTDMSLVEFSSPPAIDRARVSKTMRTAPTSDRGDATRPSRPSPAA